MTMSFLSTPTGFWASVQRAAKAVTAGLAVVVAYETTLVAVSPNPTWQEFLIGLPAYVLTHFATYHVTNAPAKPAADPAAAGSTAGAALDPIPELPPLADPTPAP